MIQATFTISGSEFNADIIEKIKNHKIKSIHNKKSASKLGIFEISVSLFNFVEKIGLAHRPTA